MRNTLLRFTSSFVALLVDTNTVIDADGRMEDIRTAMQQALSELDFDLDTGATKAWTDVVRASDIQTLWYLRSDVLRLLSDCHGEQVARARLDTMTELFRGVVHANQMPARKPKGCRT